MPITAIIGRQSHHHNPRMPASLLTFAWGAVSGAGDGGSYKAHTVLMKLSRHNRHLRRTLEVPRPFASGQRSKTHSKIVFVFCQQFSVPFLLAGLHICLAF